MLTPVQIMSILNPSFSLPQGSIALNSLMTGDLAMNTAPFWVSLCSKLAPWASISVCLAPLPTLRQVESEKSTGSLPLLPYSSMVVNAFVWLIYGLLIREKKVWVTNAVGASLGLYYCKEFSKYCSNTARNLPGTKSNHLIGASLIMLITSAIGSMLPVKVAARVVGLEGVAFCIILFASPLASLKNVIATKSAKSIPLPFSLVACVNTLLWSVVGLFEMKDFMIYAPNLMGLGFSLIQVALKLVYNDRPKGTKYAGSIAMQTKRGGAFELPI